MALTDEQIDGHMDFRLGFMKAYSIHVNRELGKSRWRDPRGYRQDSTVLIQISF